MNLYKHQIEALEWGVGIPKKIYALDMGLGKTCIAANTIEVNEKVLIICPASLKLNWEREIRTWISKIINIQILNKKADKINPEADIVIVNYDLLGRKEKKRAKPNFDFSIFDRVIVDECHLIKNPKSIRSKITAKIIKTTENAVLLSGTLMERPIELYVPLFAIGATKMSYNAFGMKFGDPKQVHLGMRTVWQYRGSTNPEQLKELLKPQTLIMYKENVIDLPDKCLSVVALDLPAGRQEKAYNFNDIIKDPRPLGFEGLAELLHEQGLRKLPLAINHIKMRLETEHKLFITAKHRDVLDILEEKLSEYGVARLDGSTKQLERQGAVDTFQNDPSCRIFLGQNTAVSVGLTLTAAKHVIIVEPEWSYSMLMQIIDRVHRIGQTENVTAELLTIHNSIDERVLYTTLEKKGYQKEIMGL